MLRDYQPTDRDALLLDMLCDALAGIRKYWLLYVAAVILLWQPLAYLMAHY